MWFSLIASGYLLLLSLFEGTFAFGAKNGTSGLDDPTPIIIAKDGYPVETHEVTTEDGYILEVHRIPFGKKGSQGRNGSREVVLLMHGILSSSADWVLTGPEKGLGYILADHGYDVWIGNLRGNTYSRNHKSLDPQELDFWKFSWDQMGEFDLPALIEYVTSQSVQDEIFYIGHSMGTTSFMVMANKHPQLQEKIKHASLLAPVAYINHWKSPLKYVAPYTDGFEQFFDKVEHGEFGPDTKLKDWVLDIICDDISPYICSNMMFLLFGFDQAQMNMTLIDKIDHHSPAGTSVRAMAHYFQIANGTVFKGYDFGSAEANRAAYNGSDTPPVYTLDKVTAPVSAYYGNNDWLVVPEDAQRAISEYPNLVSSYEVPYKAFNHIDFVSAIDVDSLLYPEVLQQMSKYL